MIYTLTLNPSVDYIVGIDEILLGSLNRTVTEAKFPGGKGINVSRVLRFYDVPSKATGFLGGFTGDYIKHSLEKEQIDTAFITVKEDTRINIKLKAKEETEINGQGPAVSTDDLELLKNQIRHLTKDDTLVLAGSIPASMPETIYEELVETCRDTGAEFVVDAEGSILRKVLPFKPFLIKPNHHELEQFFGEKITNRKDAVTYGKQLVELGAKNVIVSLAGEGAVYINNDVAFEATVPVGEVKSSVGAGDSMVAGFLACYQKTASLEDAFRFSVAAGSATAFSIGLGTKEKAEELLSQVQVTKVN